MSTKSLQNKSERFCSSRWLLKDFPFFIAIFFLVTLNVFYLFLFASFYIRHFHFSMFILSQLIYIVQFALHLNVHYSDPGKRFPATKGSEEEEQAIEEFLPFAKKSQRKNDDSSSHYCSECHLYRPLECTHCSTCNACIPSLDHHCLWIGNCVGRHNLTQFYLFLLFVILWVLFFCGSCWAWAFLEASKANKDRSNSSTPLSVTNYLTL